MFWGERERERNKTRKTTEDPVSADPSHDDDEDDNNHLLHEGKETKNLLL